MRTALISLAIAAGLAACAPRVGPLTVPMLPVVADTVRHPAGARQAVIYEINVRQYTPEGTLVALQRHLPRLQRLGVDILWVMPVQPIGRKNRKGALGSYYAIADYTAINPEIGTQAEFKGIVDAAH